MLIEYRLQHNDDFDSVQDERSEERGVQPFSAALMRYGAPRTGARIARHAAAAALVALVLCLGEARGAADVISSVRPRLVMAVPVDRVSSTAPPEDTDRVQRQVEAALGGNSDLDICLESVRVRRNAGSIAATIVFDRTREPEVSVAARGAIPAAARRCVETAARGIWLRAAPEGRVTLRVRFEVEVVYYSDGHRGSGPLGP